MVISTGAVTTLAGSGSPGSADGTGSAATFYYPTGIATDGVNLYVADNYSHKIRKIVIATGEVTTLAGTGVAGSADGTGTSAGFNRPYGVTTDGLSLYVTEGLSNRIRRIQ
jgi:DNA-binding beta-propeller fold protein YncE